MKIEKHIHNYYKYWYYYKDSKTNSKIFHGLNNLWYDYGIGYRYHSVKKGFWLMNNHML